MKAAYSPSPWKVTKNGDVFANDTVLYAVRLNFSADKEQIKANAYLIAAAPEMFKLLEHLCSEITAVERKAIIFEARGVLARALGGY